MSPELQAHAFPVLGLVLTLATLQVMGRRMRQAPSPRPGTHKLTRQDWAVYLGAPLLPLLLFGVAWAVWEMSQ